MTEEITIAEIRIRLEPTEQEDLFNVEMTFSRSDDESEVAPVWGTAHFDSLALDAVDVISDEYQLQYGERLTAMLFGDARLKAHFVQWMSLAEGLNAFIRIRLHIVPKAWRLHRLRWETLRHPERPASLVTDQKVFFSRYLSTDTYRPVKRRPREEMRALVMVANPSDLAAGNGYVIDGHRLSPLDVKEEFARAQASLGDLRAETLPEGQAASLDALIQQLRSGYDILYIVCHGALIDGQSWLWLENDTGGLKRTSGDELVERLSELQNPPRLVVLASCQSARADNEPAATDGEPTTADRGALAAVGPRLAERGVPAVIAVQSNITIETMHRFLEVFFGELVKESPLDCAVSVARQAVAARADHWMPVLYMRLKTGQLWWYTPNFSGNDNQQLKTWDDILRHLKKGKCTPILGHGLTEFLYGSSRDIARRWCAKNKFPLAAYVQDDLPQVAQYRAIDQSLALSRGELTDALQEEVLHRYGRLLTDEQRNLDMEQLVLAVWEKEKQRNPAEPHNVLAHLPLPVYFTTGSDDLLDAALRGAGKQPRRSVLNWKKDRESSASTLEDANDSQRDPQQPLIYHLFGHYADPQSLIITEDDLYDYLIGSGRNKELVPTQARSQLSDSSWLFLGFYLEEWSFRLLYRSIKRLIEGDLYKEYSHTLVQIDPAESRISDPAQAKAILNNYFQDPRVNIYLGSVEDFAKQLNERWKQKYGVELAT